MVDDHCHPIATTAAAAVVGSIVHTKPAGCVPVVVGGISDLQCGSTWYQPQYAGTPVSDVMVNPPR